MRPKWCGEVIPRPHTGYGEKMFGESAMHIDTYFYFILFFNLHISYPA